MKRIILSIVFLSAFLSHPIFAADQPQTPPQKTSSGPLKKLNRGLINIVTSPIEIARQVDQSWKEGAEAKSIDRGIFSGIMKGIMYTAGRMSSGIWDVVSFPFQTPKNYDSIMKPDYVLDNEPPKEIKKNP